MIDCPLHRLKFKRGQELPHSKLTDDDVRYIRRLVERRDRIKRELKALTNASIAKSLKLHVRTVDRVTAGENWNHVE